MLPLPRGAVWQIFFLLCAVLLANEVRSEERVVCYYTNWSVYRPGTAKFNPQNINPYLCTHLIYAFGGFTKDNTMKPFDKYQDIEQGGYAKFTGLKTYNKQLKTMIAIGGWNEASSRFSPLVANAERRQKFIKNILKFLRQNHFDGLDLDWEYPAHRDGGKSRDKDNYAQFVQELRSEFDRESAKTGRPRLLLTMAVPAGIQYIEKGYDIPKLNKYLDWFNMLTYDFHSSHEPSANHHAPLYSLEAEDEYNFDSDLNIDYSVKYYLDAGADRDKLVLGIPTYGRSYTLFNEESTDLGAPADGPGEQGDATREKGYLAYYEICQNIKEDPDWNVVQPNAKAMGPYAFKGNQWVGYDDEAIVRKKAEYVVENGLGGIMFWAIDNDDFRGICTGKPYPLIEAAKETYLDRLGLGDNEVSKPSSKKKPLRSRNRIASSNRNKVEEVVEKAVSVSRKRPATRKRPSTEKTTTTSTSTFSSLYVGGRTTTPQPPTTPDPGSDFKCEDEGFFQHPRDCKKYFWCLDSGPSNLGIVAHQFTCPSGLYFNPAADSCDFARNVPCNKNPKEAPSTTVKPKTTTTTTARTTTASSRITAATSRNSFARFTSTTEAPEEEDDDEYEDEVQDPEEDPRVIKELIDLIKKVGGVEELEKHLLQQEDGSVMLKKDESSSIGGTTTPSTISKSLYKKVLSRPNNLNAFRNKFTSSSLFRSTSKSKAAEEESEENVEENNTSTKYSSVVRNSRPGPQNAGIDKLPEFDGFLKEKKKYVTIQRNKPLLVSSVEVTGDEEDDDAKNIQKDAEDEDDDEEEIVVSTSRRPTSLSTPAYTSIRRTKPTIVKPAKLDDDESEEDIVVEKKAYTSASRNRVRSTTDTVPVEDEITTAAGSRYKFIERTRPTRRSTTTEPSKEDNDEETDESKDPLVTVQYSETNEISTQLPTQQQSPTTTRSYASIGRRITTTTTTSTTTTDQDPIETTTPESFVIDTTTPEPIIITTTTTTTNPTSIETSTQSFTTTPILALSASTLSSSTSQNDDEDATIASKIPNTLATESGLDTQELDTTKNQILTETTTIDENYRNEVTNLSLKTTTTSNKSQSSLNNLSSSSNSVRGTLKNNFSGGSRRQQQKQKTTTTTTIDTNQQQHETSTNTNEFLGTVSSPRPFGFPRRRTRPTTTTTTNGVDDADASSTVPTSEIAKPLAKKVSSTEESYQLSRSSLSQNVERAQTVNSGTSFVVDHVANVVGSLVGGNSVAYAAEGDLTKKRTYSWKDTRNTIYRPPKLTEKQEQDKLAIAQYYDWQVAQGGRRDDERYKHDGDWQKVWGQSNNPSLSYSGHSRYGAGTGVGLNGFENNFAGKWDSGQYRHDDSGKWRAKSLKVNAEGEGVYRRGYGTGGQDVLSAYQYEDSSDGQYADRGWRGNGGEKSTLEESSGGGYGSDESRGDGRYTEHQSKSGAYEGWNGRNVQGVSEGQDTYIRYRGQQVLSEGSDDETEANRLRSHQSFEGKSLTAGEDGKYSVKVNHGNSIFAGQSQEASKHRTELQRGSEVSEGESEESHRRKTTKVIEGSVDDSETSHRRLLQEDKSNSTEQSYTEGRAVYRTRLQHGSVVSEGESEESHQRKTAEIIGGSGDESETSHRRRVQQDKSNSTEESDVEGSSRNRTGLQQDTVVLEGESEVSQRRKTAEIIGGFGDESETSHRRRVQQDQSNSTEQSHTEGSAVHRTRLQQGSVVSEGESEESHQRKTAEIIGGSGDESETSHRRRVQQDQSNSTEQSHTEGSAVYRTRLQQGSVVSEGESEESHQRKTAEIIGGSGDESETSHTRLVQQDQSNSTEESDVEGSSRNRTGLQQDTVVLEGESEASQRRKTAEIIGGSGDESETSHRRRVQQDKSNSTEQSHTEGSAVHRTRLQQGSVASEGESEESHQRKTAEIIEGSGDESETSHRRRVQQDQSNSTEQSHTEGSAVYRTRLQQGSVVSEGESEASQRRKTAEIIGGSGDESETSHRRRVQQDKSNSTEQSHTEGSAVHRTRLQQGYVVSEGESEESHQRKTAEIIVGSGGESETSHRRRVQQDQSNSTEESDVEGSSRNRTRLQQDTVVLEGESEASQRRKTAEIIGGSGDESETSHRRRVQQDKSNSTEQSHTEGSAVHRTRLQQGSVVSEGESEESHQRKTAEIIGGSGGENETSHRRRVQQDQSNSTEESDVEGSSRNRTGLQQDTVVLEGESEASQRRKTAEIIGGSGDESETSHRRRIQQDKSNSTEQSLTEGSAVHRTRLQQGSVVSESESEESHQRKTAEIIGGSGDDSETSHRRRVQQDKSNSTEQSHTEGSAVHRTRLQQVFVVSEGESEKSHQRKTAEIIGGSGGESETSHRRRVQQDKSNSTEQSHTEGSAVQRTRLQQGSVVSEGESEESHQRKTAAIIGGSGDESETSHRRRVQQDKSNSTEQSHTEGSAVHRTRLQQGSVVSEDESEESHQRKTAEIIGGSGDESETSHRRRIQQDKSNSTEQSLTEGSAVQRTRLQQGSVVSEGESEESHQRKTAAIIGGSGDESETSHRRRVQQDKSNSTEQSHTEGSAVHRTRLQQGSVVSEDESEESHQRKTAEIIGGSGDESETSHRRRIQQDKSNSTEQSLTEGSAVHRTSLQQGPSTYSSSQNTSNTGLANDSNLEMSLEVTSSSKTLGLAQTGLGATTTLSAQDLTSMSQIKGTNQGSAIDGTISSQATGSSSLSKGQSETESSTIKIGGTGHETHLQSISNSTTEDANTTLTGSAQDLTQSEKTKLESGLNKITTSIGSTTTPTGSVLETNVDAGSDEAQNGTAAQAYADSSSTLSGSNTIRTSKSQVEDESVYKTKNLSVPRGFSKTNELTSVITNSVASDRGNSLSRTLQVKAGTHTEGDIATADRGDILYKTIKAVEEVKNTATSARGNASYKDSGVWNGHSIQVTDEDEGVSKAGRRTNKTTLQAYNIRTHHEGAIQGSGDETETRQKLRGQSHTETNDGRYRVRVKKVKSNIEEQSQENISRRVRVQQHKNVLEGESLSEGKDTLAHRGGTRYKVRLQNGSFAFEDESQESLQRRHRITLGDTADVDKKLSTTEGGRQRTRLQSDVSGGSQKSISKKTQLESEVETHATNGKQRSGFHQTSTVSEVAKEESLRSSDRNRLQVHSTKEQLSGVAKNSGHLQLSASVSEEISDSDSNTASGISTETVSDSSQRTNLTQESDISAQTDTSLAQTQGKVSEASSEAIALTKTLEVITLPGSAEDIQLESGSQTNTSSEGTTTTTSDSALEQAGLSLSPSSDAKKSSEAASEADEDLKLKSSLDGTTLAENATAALSTITQEQISNLSEGSSTTGGLSNFGANEEISSGSQTGSSATADRGKLLHLQTETGSHLAADRGHILHGTITVTEGEDKVKSSVTSDRGDALYKTTSAGDDGTYRASHQISSGTYVNGGSKQGGHSTSKTIEDHESIDIHSSSYYGTRADDSSNGEISTTDQTSHKTASESVQDGSENNSEVKTESDISSGGASNSTHYRGFKTTQITDTIVTEPDSDHFSSSKVKNQGLSEDRTRTRLESVNLATSNQAVINRTNTNSDSASISGSKVNNHVEAHARTQFEGQGAGGSLKFGTATRGHIRNQFKTKQTQSNEDSKDSESVTITDSGLEESIDKDLAPITTTSRPTAAFTSRTRFAGSARKSFTKTIESEESETKTITNSDKEVKSRAPTAIRSRSRLSESARRIQNQVVTRPRTRVFTTRTQKETASSNDSEGVQKVVSQSETKKIVTGTEEEDEDEYYYETATSTTRRPRVINRGNFRPKFNDLSSLLAIDFHRKQKPNPTEGPRVAVRRRRPVQRVTTESTAEEEIERSTRPTRPPRTTTTTVAPKSTVRPTSSLRRVESGYSSNGKYALRRKLNGNRVQNDSETSSGVSSTSTSTINNEEQAGASTVISGSEVKTGEINSTVSGTSGTQDKYTVRRKLIRKRIKSGSTNGSEELVPDGSGLRKGSQYTVRRKIIQKTIQGNSGVSTDETVSEGESLKKEELALKDTILNLLNGTHLTNQTNTAMISETEVKVDFENSSGKVQTNASSSDSTRSQIFRNRFASNSVRTQSKDTIGSDEATTHLPLTGDSVDEFTTGSEGTRKQAFRNRVSSTSFQTRTKGSSGIKELTSETTEMENPNIPRGKSRLSQSDLSSLLSSDAHSKNHRRLNFTTTDQTQGGTRRKPEGTTKTTTTTVQKTSYLTSPVTQRAFNLRKPVSSFSGLTEETPTVIDSTETILTETSGYGGTENVKKTVVTTRVIEETSGVIDKTPTVTEEIIETQETGIPQARGFSSSSTKTTHLTSSSLSNELLSEDNPTVPIYTRRKYYKYLTDSPITYLGKFGGTVGDNGKVEIEETTSSNKEHISKAILDVFDIYNHSRSAAAAKIKENEAEDGGTTVSPQDSPPNEDMKSIAQEINNQLNHFLVPAPRATTEVLGADESSTIEDHTQATEDDKDDEIYKLALDVNSMGIGGLEVAVDESGEKMSTETEDTIITQTTDAEHKTEEEATVITSLDDLESLTTVSPSMESDAQSTESTTVIHRNAKTFKVYSTDSSKPSSLEHTELDESLEVTIDEDEAFPSTTSPDAEIAHELVKPLESGSFTHLEILNQRRRQQTATEPSIEATTQGFTRRATATKTSKVATDVPDESSTSTRRENGIQSIPSLTTITELVEDDEVTTSSTTAGLLGSTRRTFTGLKRFTTAGTTESITYKDEDNEVTADIDEDESSDLITSTVDSSDTATTRRSFAARNRLQTTVKPEEDDDSTRRSFNRVRTTSTAVPDGDGTTTRRSFTALNRLRTFRTGRPDAVKQTEEAEEVTGIDLNEVKTDVGENEIRTSGATTRRTFNGFNRTRPTAIPTTKTSEVSTGDDELASTTRRSFSGFNRLRTTTAAATETSEEVHETDKETAEDLQTKIEEINSRGTFSGLSRLRTTTEEDSENTKEAINTVSTPTRRTFARLNGLRTTTTEAAETTEADKSTEKDNEDGSTTRRIFAGFNRLTTTTTEVPEASEVAEEIDTENVETSTPVTTRRTFAGFNRLRTTSAAPEASEAPEEEEANRELEGVDASTVATTGSTRRAFVGFNRLRTTTTETPKEEDQSTIAPASTTHRALAGFNRLRTTSAAPEASEAPEEETNTDLEGLDASTVATTGSTRRAFVGFNRLRTTTTETPKDEDQSTIAPASTTRRPLAGFNRLRTTTAEAEEGTEADSASTVRITDTTRPPFAGLNRLKTTTSEASDAVVEEDASTVPTIDTTTQPLTSVDLTTSVTHTEESDSSTEVNEDEPLTADMDEEGVTEEVPASSTIQPTLVNLETTTATPTEIIELSTKSEEGDEGEFTDNKTTTVTPIEATTASIAPEAESTTDAINKTATARHTFVKVNRITTTTSPTETSETPETDTTLEYTSTVGNIATTRRTFARLNRPSTTTSAPTKPSPSEAPEEENEVDVKSEDTGAPATTRRTFGGLNRLRTTTTEASIQRETAETKSPIDLTTRRTLINYNRFRTTTASAIPIEEDNQPIETEDEEENTVDVTSRRSFAGRNSIRSTTTEGPTTRRSFAPRLRTTSVTPSIDDSEEDDDNEVTPKSGLVVNRLTNAQQQTQKSRTRLQLASRQNLFNRNQGFRAQSGNTQANKDEAADDDEEESENSGEEEEIVPRTSTTTRSYPAVLNRNQFKIQGSTQSVSNEEHNEGEEEEALDEGEQGEVTNTGNIISLLNRNRFTPKQGAVIAEGEEPENEEKPTLSLLQLRNRVKTEQSQSDKDEGVINSRLQQILATADEESTAQNVATSRNRFITTRAPVATSQDNDGDKSKLSLLQLRDRVKTEQSQSDRDKGVINTRLQKNRSEDDEDDDLQSKNSLLQLRNRVKIAQFQPQDNGVINSRLQKILSNTATEDEDSTSQSNANQRSNTGFRPTQAPQSDEDDETTKLSLLQLRDRVKTAQFQSEDTGVISTRLQKLLANRKPSSPTTKFNNLTNQTTTNFTVATIVERTHTNNLSLTQSNDEVERTELGQDEDSEDSIVETNSNLSTNTPNLNRRFQRVQFNRTAGFRRPTTTTTSRTTITTSTQVNPSLDDVVDSSSTSNLGLTSAESGTSADDETTAVTSTEAALKQRRRLRVLKYRRPLIVNNSLSVESSNSTNTTTSSTESVDNLSVGPELNTTINTATSPTPTRRFRKVIKKLRPLVNRTVTEGGTSGDTERPLNIAELFSKLNSSTTTVSATESADNATVTEGTTSEQTGTEVTSEETVSTTTLVAPTPRRLLVNRRPYVPTKPSLNAITATTEANAIATPKTYVRKFNRNFKAIRPPTDAANGIGYIQRPQPTAQTQSGFQGANRFRFPTRTTPKPRSGDEHEEEDYDEENDVDEEEDEEEEEEEEDEEEEQQPQEEPERVVVAPEVRQRVLFNRNQVQSNDFKENKDEHTEVEAEDEEEDDEEEDKEVEEDARLPPVANRPIYTPSKRPSNRPSFSRPSNSPLVPNRQAPVPAPVNRFALDRRPSNKPRIVNRPTQITLPPNLLNSDQPTIPSSITPPSVFISSITRSYERKYSASTENVPQDQSNPLLEDLDIDALNARNKKIFEVNSKKHTTTIKPKIIQNQPQPGSDTTDTTQLDTSTVFQDEDNNLINSQDDSQVETTTTKVVSNYAERPASEGQLVSYSPKKKIITVSRVVEINSKEAKLSRKSKDEELRTVESTELRSEGLPKLEALGEISRVKHVHLVDGSDIVVDGHSTVTDYTPTEASIFVRNTIPEVEPDSLENTRIDYQAGPTSAPVRNTIPDVDYTSGAVDDASSASVLRKSKGITVPEVIADVVEASTISLQGLFDSTRQAKKISETANEVRTATIPVRRPVVRRRLFTTAQPAASTSNDELNADGTSTISTINTDDDVVSATSPTTSNFKYNRRTRPSYLTTIAAKLKPTPKALSSSLTSSNPGEITTIVSTTGSAAASSNDITFVTVNKLSNQKFPSGVMRRKIIRPLNANRSTPADSSRSTVPSDEVAITDPPRTQNPLFKRRFPFSTTSRPAVVSTPPAATEFNTSPFYLDTLIPEDIDQVAKSSIQEAKFFQNQISDNLSEPDHSPEISISTSTFSSTTPLYLSTYEEAITRRLGTAATTRRPSLRRPQKTTPTPEKAAVFVSRRRPHKAPAPFNKIIETQTPGGTYEHAIDYDYYDDGDERVVDRPTASQVKVVLHGKGIIECLDQGNFPHPLSCRKFISCAKFETGGVVGWEYTCPKGLSYDPVGGMCNWAAGLGCKE